MSSDYEDRDEINESTKKYTGSVEKCAAALKQDMIGSQSTIDYYKDLMTHSIQYVEAKEFFALKCQSVTAQEFVDAIKKALNELPAQDINDFLDTL